MKKSFYILSALLALAACSKEMDVPVRSLEPLPEGTMAKVDFTVVFPENIVTTRAAGDMSDQPDITKLYVAILGSGEGVVKYWLPATLETVSQEGYDHKATYSVMLPLSSERTPIHFVGNPPADYLPVFDESEKSQMDRLITTGKAGAYWQKVILDKVPAKIDPNTGTYATDDDGNYLVDIDNAFVYGTEGTQNPQKGLKDVALVRNFAKINYSAAEDADFTIDAWTLINIPASGYITPYQNGYDTPYVMIGDYTKKGETPAGDFFNLLEQQDYAGYQTPDAIDTSKPEEPTSCPAAFYMYERRIPDAQNAQTAVVAHIQWNETITGKNAGMAGKDFWYKIELMDEDNEYFPFRRNIYYNFILEDIEGDGEDSFDSACSGPYFGDISASIETANLNEVDNNQSRMIVNQMDFVHVGGNSRTFVIDFQFYPDASSSAGVITAVNNSATSGNYVNTTLKKVDGYDHAVTAVTPQAASGGWGHIQVTVSGSGENTLRSKVRVQGNATGKRVIYRDITFTVMEKQDLTASVETPDGTTGKEKKVMLTITLPTDLSYSMFPLQFQIEPKNKNLSTNDSTLPVQFGPSAYDSSKNNYYFLKTITFSEYCKIVNGAYQYTTSFPCEMFTTQDGANDIDISVKNIESQGYFNEWTYGD